MGSSPNHPGWPKNRSEAQKLIEYMAHMVYRDAIQLIHPELPLELDFKHRLAAIHINRERVPVTREYVDDLRENLAKLKENYNKQGQTFHSENITICITVFNLIYRLEFLKEHEQDMKPRLVERLETVRMARKWDPVYKTGVWVLETEDNVPEGLARGKAKKQYGRTAKKDNGAGGGEAMESTTELERSKRKTII